MLKEKLNIAIRVDANSEIGGGHFRRCLTLAQEAQKRGHSIKFISAQLPEKDRLLLKKNKLFYDIISEKNQNENITSKKIPNKFSHDKWLKLSILEDAKITSKSLDKFNPNWIIFDHYSLNIEWVNIVKKKHNDPYYLAIDDLDNRNLGSDFLLDQTSIIKKERIYKVPGSLVGPKFALISNKFDYYRNKSIQKRSDSKSFILKNKNFFILISLGLYDKKKLLPILVDTLSKMKNATILVATSSECQTLSKLKKLCQKYKNFSLHLDSKNMAELMLKADVCIGASGMSMWERCCMGIPSLTITIAKNQQKVTKQVTNLNISKQLRISVLKNKKKLLKTISDFIYSPKKLQQLSENSYKICDGKGTDKVINFLEANLKKVEIKDSFKLLSWRNKKFIRANSLNKQKINTKSHERWMEKTQNFKRGIWLIYSEGGKEIGHCSSIYVNKEVVYWSFYIGEPKFSPGSGIRMLVFFLKKLFFEIGISKIEANVTIENCKSQKLHKDLGFSLNSSNDHFQKYSLTKDFFKKRYYSNI